MIGRLKNLSPWSPIGLTALVILIVGISGSWAYWRYQDSSSRSELARLRAELEEAGYKTRLGDFNPPTLADADNGALFLKRHVDAIEEWHVLQRDYEDSPLDLHEEHASALGKHRNVVEDLQTLPRTKGLDFGTDYSDLKQLRFEMLLSLRRASHLLLSTAAEDVRAGRHAEAMKTLEALDWICKQVKREPLLLNQLVCDALVRELFETLEVTLPGLDDPRKVLDAMNLISMTGSTTKSLRGEIAYAIACAELLDDSELILDVDSGALDHLLQGVRAPFLRKLTIRTVKIYRGLDESVALPFSEREKLIADGERQLEKKPWNFLVEDYFSMASWNHVLETEYQARTRRRLAHLAAALLSHRKKNGSWPGSLDDLGLSPDDLVEPFEGRPIRWLATSDACWLISPRLGLKAELTHEELIEMKSDFEQDNRWGLWRVDAPVPPRTTDNPDE